MLLLPKDGFATSDAQAVASLAVQGFRFRVHDSEFRVSSLYSAYAGACFISIVTVSLR